MTSSPLDGWYSLFTYLEMVAKKHIIIFNKNVAISTALRLIVLKIFLPDIIDVLVLLLI